MNKQKNLESVCKHFSSCDIAKISGRDCSFPAYLNCQTYKFYEKYGEYYLLIAIGEQAPPIPSELNGEYLE